MPFISDTQLAKLQTQVGGIQNKALKAKESVVRAKERMIGSAEVIGGGAVAGFARGKLEEADGSMNLPFVDFDAEAAAGLAMLATGYYIADKKAAQGQHVINVANGVLAHYSGQIMRKLAKTGEFTLVAGSRRPSMLSQGRATVGCSPLQTALAGGF